MQELADGIEVPAGGEVTLVPGDLHVMLMNIEEPLEDGDEVTLTLTFENAGEVSFTVPAAQMGSNGDGEDDMDGMDGMSDGEDSDDTE
ncbi:MAG: copper chaperone PCu(A)C [Dehalococcoidia bacterium]|nr:copper chaperone PCu(A)C [Dehalococcoidia bacterium]